MRIEIPRSDSAATAGGDQVIDLVERRQRRDAVTAEPSARAATPGRSQKTPASSGRSSRPPASSGRSRSERPTRSPAAPRSPIARARHRRQVRRRVVGPTPLPVAFWAIAASTAMLCLFGLLMVLSATTVKSTHEYGTATYFFAQQAKFLALGAVGLFVAAWIGPRRLSRFANAGLVVTGVMLSAVLVFGNEVKGARRWFTIGVVNVQPSEIAKVVLVVWSAAWLARHAKQMREWKATIAPVVGVFVALGGLIVAEPDLGTTVVLACVLAVVLWVAGARRDILGILALIGLPLFVVASNTGYHADRWGFLNPWANSDGKNFQLVGSLAGFARGSWFGTGPGGSIAKWGFLPEAHTDAIFAVIGEEMGVIGAFIVIGLYVTLFGAGMVVARDSQSLFDRLVAIGISVMIGLQALVNIGVSLGVLPNKGFTLPLVSYGGSSLLVTLFSVGLLLHIARHPAARSGRRRRRPVRATRPAREARVASPVAAGRR